jgi:dihydroflavonol-4-reductase
VNGAITAFLTGATGFVGSAVARAIIAQGLALRVLVRPASVRTNLEGLAVEVVEGDLLDAAALARGMRGARYVFHVAADYRLWTPSPHALMRTNLEGTRNVMDAALATGVDRVVYTSSVATLAVRSDGSAADESVSLHDRDAVGAYKKSKIAAERLVLEMVRDRSLPAVIVNPSTPIGPRDIKPTPTGRIIINAAAGRMPGYVDTGLNLVHVDDVATGHWLALRHGRIGERYILGGQDASLADLLRTIATLVGRRAPALRLPRSLLYGVAIAAESWAALTKREPFVTLDGLRMSRHRMYYSSAKAQDELGYRARPYVEAVQDAIDWSRKMGMLR